MNHFQNVEPGFVFSQRLSFREVNKSSKDLFLMSSLQSGALSHSTATRGTSCLRQRYQLSILGCNVCLTVYLSVHDFHQKTIEMLIRTHFEAKGVVPRQHGNKGKKPHQ